ncbi:MAG: 30S ribosomal protein S24e [Thermoplasmata archaeon]|nr:30S ribosomal protein S24e [Thermoplasmata archaeon]
MEIEFIETKENKLLDRTEIKFKATHTGEATASRDAIREKIASLARSTKEKVILDSMNSKFGLGETIGYAKIYRTIEAAKKHERKHVLIRNKLIEGDKKTAAPAAPKPAPATPPTETSAALPAETKK